MNTDTLLIVFSYFSFDTLVQFKLNSILKKKSRYFNMITECLSGKLERVKCLYSIGHSSV